MMIHYFGPPRDFFGFASGRQPGVADMVSGQMDFQNGTVFQGVWCFTASRSAARDKCMLSGSHGKIEFSFFSAERVYLSTDEINETYDFSNPENIQLPLIDRVVKYFSGAGENPCTGQDGLKVMEIIDKFTAS
jgi:predicted dehydrogenase